MSVSYDGASYNTATDEEDLEEVNCFDDAEEVLEYPWPCPDNWPLAGGNSQSTVAPSESASSPSLISPRTFHFKEEINVHPVDKSDVAGKSSSSSSSSSQRNTTSNLQYENWSPQVTYPEKAMSVTARSFSSVTSSRRRDRASLIETFNRKYIATEAIAEERKLYFSTSFRSRRITQPQLKPWISEKESKKRAVAMIPFLGFFVGMAVGCYLIYTGYAGVAKHDWCLVLDEDWSNGIDDSIWTREVNLGGFGTGEFEWATNSDNNSYVQDGKLYIVPTLTSDALGVAAILNGGTVDLTADGSCTGTTADDCVATSNSTTNTILPPVQSARLISKGKFNMKYGKIEVVAKMPRGDWLWPAIWMLPENNVYGDWPLSGEIDIAESRGNPISYKDGGRNQMSTTLHWGPSTVQDAFWRTNAVNQEYHSDFTEGFNTFGLEWTDEYLYTYINSHLRQVFYLKFDEPFFDKGRWPAIDATNKTAIENPWAGSTKINVAPFDQSFYLILNVAVGTSYGFFPDGVGNKPWVDGTSTARSDFYSAVETWYPTWGTHEDRSMVVKSVKAWQICGT